MSEEQVTCEECQDLVLIEDSRLYHGSIVCIACFDRHYRTCVVCEAVYDYDAEYPHGDVWAGMCRSCSHDHFECTCCGGILHVDSLWEDSLCRACHIAEEEEKSVSVVEGYHTRGAAINFLPTNYEPLYYGVELETEGYAQREDAARAVFKLSKEKTLFCLEHDCSLNAGFELITQPATLDYHREQFPWKEICQVLREHEGRAEDSEHAAMHVHASTLFFAREATLGTLKLLYLVEKHRAELLLSANTSAYLANRSAHRLIGHKSIFSSPNYNCSLHELARKHDRFTALNPFPSYPTLEFRIFRSTLNVDRIIANLELTDRLVRLAAETDVSGIKKLSWAKIAKLPKGNGYVHLDKFLCPKRVIEKKRLPLSDKQEQL